MRGKKILNFVLGFLCFIIAQPLLRFPLLGWLNQNPDFTLVRMMNPLLIGVLIALSAGTFEETCRFLFKFLLIKPDKCAISQPILFGLGHGIAEACVVLLPAVSIYSISSLALLERFLAIIFHVTVTIVVWNGFQRNKKVLYLLLAILLHGMMDALIPIISTFTTSLIIFEGAFLVVDIFMVIYAFHSRKYYLKEVNQ